MGPHPRRIYGDQLHRLPESRSRPRRGFTATGHGHRPVEEGLRSMAVSTNQRLPVRDRARVPGRRAPGWCRQRVQHRMTGHRGHICGLALPSPKARPRFGADRITSRQAPPPTIRLRREESLCVEATWDVYQRIMAAYSRGDDLDGKAEIKP